MAFVYHLIAVLTYVSLTPAAVLALATGRLHQETTRRSR